MRELNWPLIWQLTRKGLRLGLKSGAIAGSTVIGGGGAILFMILSISPNTPKDKFWLFGGEVYLAGLGGSLVVGLVFGLLIGFMTGYLTAIFIKYLPDSEKYRIVTMWATFFACFVWTYLFTGSMFGIRSGSEMFGLIVACYGSWISSRLVNFVEDSLLTKPLPEPEYIADYSLTYRISKLKNEGLTRFEIDRELLGVGRTAEELEKAWRSFDPPAPLPAQAKPRTDWNSWGKVAAGAIVPIAVVALVCWVV